MIMSIGYSPSSRSGHGSAGTGASADHLVTERLSDRLAALLGGQIQAGQLQPGDRLPSEAQLAETHGVSRTVVREAVHQLKSRGLLRSRQGSGVYVALPPLNQSLAFDPTVLDSVDAVVHVVEVRRVLEGEIAALAAERANASQIKAMRKALLAIDTAGAAGRDGVAEDLAFHRVIGEASGNPQFVLLMGFFEQYLREAMRITRGNEARRQDFMDAVRLEHQALVEAIASRDPDAARRRATDHLLHGEQRLVEGGVINKRRKKAVAGRTQSAVQAAAPDDKLAGSISTAAPARQRTARARPSTPPIAPAPISTVKPPRKASPR